MAEAREVGVVPEWVAAVAASERKRIPVGEVSSWCRTPHADGMVAPRGRHFAREGQTLAEVAAEAFPMRCLACWTEHEITGLRLAQQEATGVIVAAEHLGEIAEDKLDQAACPACGTVGLWPPVRPEKELAWANKGLLETYGWLSLLPEGQEVLVPELCGHECVQINDKGPANTFCGPDCPRCAAAGTTPVHGGRKSDRAREVALRNSRSVILVPRRPVDLDAAAEALAEAEQAVPAVVVAEDASAVAEVPGEAGGGEVARSQALAAPLAPESRPGGASGGSAELAAGAALVAALSGVGQPPAGAAGGDAYGRAWASLTATVRTMAETVKHASRTQQEMEALAAERVVLQQEAREARAAAEKADERVATIRANAEAEVSAARDRAEEAEDGRVAAQARADTLAEQLADLQRRYDELIGAAGAGGLRQMLEDTLDDMGVRRATGRGVRRQRLSQPQKDMMALIAGNRADAVVVARVADEASPGNSAWFVHRHEAGDGELKTLKSLQRRGLVTWGEFNAEGVAMVELTVPGEEALKVRAVAGVPEAAAVADRGAAAESDGSVASAALRRTLQWWELEDGVPPEKVVADMRQQIQRPGRITWEVAHGSNQQTWHQGGAPAINPVRALLSWMYDHKIVTVDPDGSVRLIG